ncbi:MAG: prepilin peptidase [Planctomycetota bacterium]|nr:prepilin peptidase [Planctomycetota bacterium]MDI6788013.1 prepilin peptidase [Planctomycetota bacterium]
MSLEYFYFITIFLFGLIIGSFLNVCIYRLPRDGMSILNPSSFCPECKCPVRWYHNIPLFSFIFLGGKCSSCSKRISLRYPLVELLTALLFVLSAYWYLYPFNHFSGANLNKVVWFVVSLYLISSLIIATFIDIEFRIIPDEITIAGTCLSLVVSALFPFIHTATILSLPDWFTGAGLQGFVQGLTSALCGILAGGGIIFLVGFIGELIFRKPAMGFGDVKLMAFLGGFLGPESILYIFLIGCVFGSVIGIILYLMTREHYIAFGPYLALAALIVMFFKPQVVHLVFTAYPNFIRGLIG